MNWFKDNWFKLAILIFFAIIGTFAVSLVSFTSSASVVHFVSFTNIANAHPGRTDSSGGHTCRTNCPGWGLDYGEYHYHGGSASSTPPPPPPPQTWSFNGKTYYSYSSYLQAQEDYKKEQERIAQEKLIQEQEEENKKLQAQLRELKEQQSTESEVAESNDNVGLVAGASDNNDSSGSGAGATIGFLGVLALLGGGGLYLHRRRKRRIALNSSNENID
jgi:hypothetical protein